MIIGGQSEIIFMLVEYIMIAPKDARRSEFAIHDSYLDSYILTITFICINGLVTSYLRLIV